MPGTSRHEIGGQLRHQRTRTCLGRIESGTAALLIGILAGCSRLSAATAGASVSDTTITFLVLAAVVVVFVWDRLPVALVAIGVALSLWATGVLDLDQALAGFGDPAVIFIASLFVVSEALDATGVTAWAGQQLIAAPARAGRGCSS